MPALCSANAALEVPGNLFPAIEKHGGIVTPKGEQRDSWRNLTITQACAFYSPFSAILSVIAMLRQLTWAALTLAAGRTGVVIDLPNCPAKEKKQNIERQAENNSNHA